MLTDKQQCSKYILRRTLWMQNGGGVGGRGRVDVGRGVRAVYKPHERYRLPGPGAAEETARTGPVSDHEEGERRGLSAG